MGKGITEFYRRGPQGVLTRACTRLEYLSSTRCFMQPAMQPACEHTRTQVIVRRDGVDYVECLDCRQIFEAEDLEPVKAEEEEE
jgi:Zn ribbon nucleic-acid-binding protein